MTIGHIKKTDFSVLFKFVYIIIEIAYLDHVQIEVLNIDVRFKNIF